MQELCVQQLELSTPVLLIILHITNPNLSGEDALLGILDAMNLRSFHFQEVQNRKNQNL